MSTLHVSCFLLDYSVSPTCVSNGDHLLQDLLFEGAEQSLHNDVVVCAGCESYQGGGGGSTRQLDLNNPGKKMKWPHLTRLVVG